MSGPAKGDTAAMIEKAFPGATVTETTPAGPVPGLRFVTPQSLSVKWADKLLVIRPESYGIVTNETGSDEAAHCRVLLVDDRGNWYDQGEADLYWRVVIGQLRELCNAEYPWLSGVLVKMGNPRKSYMELRPPTPEQQHRAQAALAAFCRTEGATPAPAGE